MTKFRNINSLNSEEKKEFASFIKEHRNKNISDFWDFVKSFESKNVSPARFKDYLKAYNALKGDNEPIRA